MPQRARPAGSAAALLLFGQFGPLVPAGAARLDQVAVFDEAHDGQGNESSAKPVLDEGDSWNCENLSFTLGKKLGQGSWGAVFVSSDEQHAVKVEIRRNDDDKFWHFKNLVHECAMMRDLEHVRGINVPRCLALCAKDGYHVMVMDHVKDAQDMKEVRKHKEKYDMYKIGRGVYKSVTAMLGEQIVNVDQDSKNILVNPASEVYFIDMGMAERQSELEEMLNNTMYARKYAVIKKLADLGSSAANAYQIGLEYSGTASSAIGSLPARSLDAMRGLVDAFCEDSHRELAAEVYYVVSASARDKLLLAAFKGEYKWGDLVAPALLTKKAGTFIKSVDGPIKVAANQAGRKEQHEIPRGAVLVGVKCSSEWQLTNLADFNPARYADDICEGLYYFKMGSVQYLADKVMSMLARLSHRHGSAAAQLKEQAMACQV